MGEVVPDQTLIAGAAALATTRVPVARPEDSAGTVREAMIGKRFDCADEVPVLDGDRLVGIVPLRDLLAAEPDAAIAGLMDPDPPVLSPGADQEPAAWAIVRRGESSAPVVDEAGRFLGLIPAHRLLGALLTDHDQDMARLGGYLASTERARTAAEEEIPRRLWHRLPWLIVGLAGAMASAVIVGAFEEQLDSKVLLAFFLPGVVYMADAVGTQTETVLIRGFSAGIHIRTVVRREVVTGIIIGLLIGAAFFPFALVGWGDEKVALGVSVALFASASIATSVATILPRVLQRLGSDPAFGSGPLATIIQDLLSIAVYLAIVTPIAT